MRKADLANPIVCKLCVRFVCKERSNTSDAGKYLETIFLVIRVRITRGDLERMSGGAFLYSFARLKFTGCKSFKRLKVLKVYSVY